MLILILFACLFQIYTSWFFIRHASLKTFLLKQFMVPIKKPEFFKKMAHWQDCFERWIDSHVHVLQYIEILLLDRFRLRAARLLPVYVSVSLSEHQYLSMCRKRLILLNRRCNYRNIIWVEIIVIWKRVLCSSITASIDLNIHFNRPFRIRGAYPQIHYSCSDAFFLQFRTHKYAFSHFGCLRDL